MNTPLTNQLPSAVQVLCYDEKAFCSYWIDCHHKCRTLKGLLEMLNKGIKSREYSAYRFITIHQEQYGLTANKSKK